MVMVFNTTFNNISVISMRSVLLVEETEVSFQLAPSLDDIASGSFNHTPEHSTITMQYSFFQSAIRTWNTLPQQLASMTSLEGFRLVLANTTIVPYRGGSRISS
jgi:hypothetical protein